MDLHARRFDTGEGAVIYIEGDRVHHVGPSPTDEPLPVVAPGLIDLQVNGYGGVEFLAPDLDEAKVEQVSRAMWLMGVTRYCPTVTTHSFERLRSCLTVLASACEQSEVVRQQVLGFHLEGPYISPHDGPRGAHPREHCRPPDWDEFQRLQEAARGRIVLVTLSAEYEESIPFIARLAKQNVTVAIGHTAARSDQIRAAVDAGATLSTHLGNGAHAMLPRHPNYLWDQLAEDRLAATLIADGHHLPPEVFKCFVRVKGPERCILISDIVGMAGMPPGKYERTSLGPIEILEDGRLVVAGQRQYLAGAALPLLDGVGQAMEFADLDMADALAMATQHPVEALGGQRPTLDVGQPADLVLLHFTSDPAPRFQLLQTIKAGRVVFSSPAPP